MTFDVSNRAILRELAHSSPMRLGVEFLPPAADESAVAVTPAAARAQDAPATAPARPQAPISPTGDPDDVRSDRHTWTLSIEDLSAMRTPLERETLQFLADLRHADLRRQRRELGTPILTIETVDLESPELRLMQDDALADERAEWLTEHGFELFRRPASLLLRRLPLVQGLQVELDDFKSDNVPLSAEYRQTHQDEPNLGRVSMRVRANDLHDPVEIAYMKSGVRIGTSQGMLKLGYTHRLTDNIDFSVRPRLDYATGAWHVRADLGWTLSHTTSLHLVAGDNLDFLATSNFYSLFDSPMDGSPGLLFYAVHLF
ncbi:MAG TPA: hypothetical protein VFA35_10825 [Burkholderiaceae bacterium]|nr:hypothetical protein [Burkholderiaceae bacterium]